MRYGIMRHRFESINILTSIKRKASLIDPVKEVYETKNALDRNILSVKDE